MEHSLGIRVRIRIYLVGRCATEVPWKSLGITQSAWGHWVPISICWALLSCLYIALCWLQCPCGIPLLATGWLLVSLVALDVPFVHWVLGDWSVVDLGWCWSGQMLHIMPGYTAEHAELLGSWSYSCTSSIGACMWLVSEMWMTNVWVMCGL